LSEGNDVGEDKNLFNNDDDDDKDEKQKKRKSTKTNNYFDYTERLLPK
jgi:hypothetical protein